MIADLKPYPAMKDSGVSWLGKVPEHWELLPALAAYNARQVKNTGMIETTVLSLSYGRIIVKPPEKLRGLIPESFETYQIVDPENIIVRTTDLQNDHTSLRIGHSQHRGIITSAYMCLKTTTRVLNAFGYQFLNAYDLLKIIYGFGSGLRQNLGFSDIKRMPVLVPPLPEQAAIVRFLDHADRRIRRYIRAKQNLIKLLEEQKQAIIHRAVTRGLDPNVRLKPSGVEWQGEVPERWGISRLGRLTKRIGDGLHGTPQYVEQSEYPFINGNNLSNGRIAVSDVTRCVSKVEYVKHKVDLDDTTILMSINGTIGNVAYYDGETVLLGKSAAYFKCGVELSRRYLFYTLQSQKVLDLLCSEATGTTILNVSLESLRRLPVPLPTLHEQEQIASYLSRYAGIVDDAVGRIRRELDCLNEYRTRLIADVVTGKLEVREAAARLPDEPEEPEPLDEVDAMIDAEEEPGDDLDTTLEEAEA